uniref:G_PROTEIN_RECEP_F3_4 domain-containing protein n=1 Tax=Rhabditophanes sp. KR3021 TaxID=114890 RepID=A0AC35U6M4_9BILA
MGLQVLIIQLSFVAVLSALLLNKYGNWRIQHKIVTLSTFIGWYLSFIIIFVLPLDVGITFYEKCISEQMNSNQSTLTCDQPNGMVDNDVLYDLWRIVYWTSQLLTWIVLPIMQKYSTAADFTACRKLKSAILNNAIYYTSYLVIFVLCLLYALSKGLTLNWEHLRVLTTTASNSWGLFLLVVLLGYGLIEVPRKMWLISDPKYRLNKLYFSLSNIRAGKNEAEETTKEVYKEARDALELLKNDFDTRENIAEIVSKFKKDLIREIDAVKSNADYSHGGIQIDNLDIIRNITYLVCVDLTIFYLIICI